MCRLLAEQIIDGLAGPSPRLDIDDFVSVERALGTDLGQRGAVEAAIAAVKAWKRSGGDMGSDAEDLR